MEFDNDDKLELLNKIKNPDEVIYTFRRTMDFFKFYREFIGRIEI